VSEQSEGDAESTRLLSEAPTVASAATASAAPRPAPPMPVGNALPAGYRVHEFEIASVLGVGGFGIVYLARDTQLGRIVALKEYMPGALATRGPGHVVSINTEDDRETFELGLASFVKEARMLASFDHPSLVKVYRFWEQNGTAFMVMPFYEGPTLKAWLKQQPQPPDEAWLKRLLGPLLDALEAIHADHCYHRDIAADNILLLERDQRPLLLDFGAARRAIGDTTQAFTVILKPGYAPVEQYSDDASMKQGPWTDIYALCAVLHVAITGRVPAASVSRLLKDDYAPLARTAAGRYSPAFLAAIDRGLSLRPEDRPQDVATLRRALFADTSPAHAGATPGDDDDERTVMHPTLPSANAPAASPVPSPLPVPAPSPLPAAAPRPAPEAPPVAGGRRGTLVGGGLAVAALVAAGAWFALKGGTPAAPAAAPVAAAPAPPAPAPSAVAPAPARAPFALVAVLDDLVRHSDALISVNALADDSQVVVGKDRIRFRVRSSEAGHLYVFLAGTDDHLWLMFPNKRDADNRVAADTEVVLPRKSWEIVAGGPPGVDSIVAMVSRTPRDFAAAGIRPDGDMGEFDPARLRRLWEQAPAGQSPLAGTPACAGAANCDAAFGATLIRITEVDGR